MARDENERIGGYPTGDIQSCVVEEVDQYLERFEGLESGCRQFNWAAALFCERWLAFRLMWREALALMAATLLFEAALQVSLIVLRMSALNRIRLTMAIVFLASLLKHICMGSFGDGLYWKYVRKTIDYFHNCPGAENKSAEEIRGELKENGGATIAVMLLYSLVEWGVRSAFVRIFPGLIWYQR